MTKIEELRNHILNATCSGDLPDTALTTFDDMVEAVEVLERIDRLHPVGTILVEVVQARDILEKFR